MTLSRRTFMTAPALGVLPSIFGERMSAFAQRRVAEIDWYYEIRGRGAPIVLIPSGEGDCGSFERTAERLARSIPDQLAGHIASTVSSRSKV